MKLFTTTENKEYMRSLDLTFIKEEYDLQKKKLRYFGLPSEGLYDIQRWNDFISDIVAVEMGSKSSSYAKQSLLVSRAVQLGYYDRLVLLRGDINEIIITGRDECDTAVPYPFQLVNLDYGGSVLYPDRKRIEAIEILFSHQRPEDFLLLITSNIREFDERELLSTEERIKKEITQFRPEIEQKLNDYFGILNKTQSVIRQILHAQILVKSLAENNKYEITCFPAIQYEGSRETKLIHYIFRCRFQKLASTRVISNQSLLNLVTQKTQELQNGKLVDLGPILILS